MPSRVPVRDPNTNRGRIAVGAVLQELVPQRDRMLLIIQNAGTTTIYVRLGDNTPALSAADYDFALGPSSVADKGDGGAFITDSWEGAVQVIGSGAGGFVTVVEALA